MRKITVALAMAFAAILPIPSKASAASCFSFGDKLSATGYCYVSSLSRGQQYRIVARHAWLGRSYGPWLNNGGGSATFYWSDGRSDYIVSWFIQFRYV
jgi:phospholipase/lecithinase/hemolysin